MKQLLVILAFCALSSASNCQSPEIHLLNWTCTEGQQVEGLSSQYNTVTIQYETSWIDGQPKKIGAVLDGDTSNTRWKYITTPGIDTISILYPHPYWGYYHESGVVLDMFNITQSIHHDGTSGDESYVRVYRAPVHFNLGEPVAGSTTISGQAHVSDWNVPEAVPGPDDCGGKESRVQFRVVSCENGVVFDSTEYVQSFDTPDYYDYALDFPPFTSVRIEMRLLHTENGLLGPFGPNVSSVVATTTSDCIMADISTGIHTDVGISEQIESVAIYDMSGKVIRRIMASPRGIAQTIEGLSEGIYIVQVGHNAPYRISKH